MNDSIFCLQSGGSDYSDIVGASTSINEGSISLENGYGLSISAGSSILDVDGTQSMLSISEWRLL